MISVVCVFNDAKVLRKNLLTGLARQNVPYDLVLIDNTESKFASASAALTEGGQQAKGEWILFVHQDIVFLSPSWLERAERLLATSRPRGWVGVAGVTEQGLMRGFLIDRDCLVGGPGDGLTAIQTLDECVLIHKRKSDDGEYFDRKLEGWHSYGVEACIKHVSEGGTNYVLRLPTWHDSKSLNINGLEIAHQYVWRKYRDIIPQIATTCGLVPDSYLWEGKAPTETPRLIDRIAHKAFRTAGFTVRNARTLGVILEALTQHLAEVHVLHQNGEELAIETRGFVPATLRPRRIINHFVGSNLGDIDFTHLVVMPEVTPELLTRRGGLGRLVHKASRVLLCVRLRELWRHPSLCKTLAWTRRSGVVNIPIRASEEAAQYVLVFLLQKSANAS